MGESLGGAEGLLVLLEAMNLRQRKVWVEEESQTPDGSEFHTVGAATLKPRETKVVRTQGTDNRLVFEKHTFYFFHLLWNLSAHFTTKTSPASLLLSL